MTVTLEKLGPFLWKSADIFESMGKLTLDGYNYVKEHVSVTNL
ncbi:MAG: hypothetical protein ACTSRE_08270 [Promethearchaeota archaeon]